MHAHNANPSSDDCQFSMDPSIAQSLFPPFLDLQYQFPFFFLSLHLRLPTFLHASVSIASCPMPTRNIQNFQSKHGTSLGSVRPPSWAADYERYILWRDIQDTFVGVIYLQHPSGNSRVLFMTDKNGELYVASFFSCL